MPLNILLADDSVPAQNMGKKILVDAGYQVMTASNGLEALRKIAETTPDIAILDIFMPGYTGLELCERLRATDATAALPIILTVGKLEPYRTEDGEHVHANAVIVKPFAAAELIAAVRSLIGTPPAEAAESKPEPSSEGRADDTDNDPLREISAAGVAFPEPNSFDPCPGSSLEEGLDDLVFSYGESTNSEDAAPSATQNPGPGSSEHLLPSADWNGPESLVFNPDAGPTPFSASVIDLLPSASTFQAENDSSAALAEFELQPAASHEPSPELGVAFAEEYSFSAAALDGQSGFVADIAQDFSAPLSRQPEPAIASAETSYSLETPAESEFPTLEDPFLNPWLDESEIASSADLTPNLVETDAPAEDTTSEVVPLIAAGGDVASTFDVPVVEDDEARRLAFEALFDSTESLPEEEGSPALVGMNSSLLPSVANQSAFHSGKVEPDSEIESLIDNHDHGYVTPELDPYLMHEEELVSEASRIPERDLLLDDDFENVPTQAALTNSDSSAPSYADSLMSGELGEGFEPLPALSVESNLAEAQLVAEENPPVAQKSLAAWAPPALAYLAGIVEAACEAVPRQPKAVSEIVPAESPVTSQSAYGAPELHVDPPVPVQEPDPTPEPVREPEPEPSPEPPESVPSELAELPSRTPVAEIHSASVASLPLDETERIHQAVDRVFDRFKRLLVAAIVRELARPD